MANHPEKPKRIPQDVARRAVEMEAVFRSRYEEASSNAGRWQKLFQEADQERKALAFEVRDLSRRLNRCLGWVSAKMDRAPVFDEEYGS